MNFLMLQEKLLRVGYAIVWGIVFGFESIIWSACTRADPTLGVKTTGLVQNLLTLMPGNANFVRNL